MAYVTLIVEDDVRTRTKLVRQVEEAYAAIGLENEEVLTAASLEEGLALAAVHRPVVILLDVRFTGRSVNGIDLIPAFRQVSRLAQVIMITTMPVKDDEIRAMRLKAFSYCPKDNVAIIKALVLGARISVVEMVS